MVGLSHLRHEERQIMDQKFAGSSPVRRPSVGLCLGSLRFGDTSLVFMLGNERRYQCVGLNC